MADEPQPTYVTPLQAERRLTAYLSDASQLGILYPPQGLDPQDVIRILKDKVAEDATGEPLARMIRTVELYDLYEATDYLKSFLKRAERDADSWTRSTKVVAALARVARGDDWAVARDYYRYLTTKAQTYVRLASLLECLEALGPQEPPDALRQAAESRLKLMQAQPQDDWAAGVEARKIERLLANDLKYVEAANQIKTEIEALKDPQARATACAKLYSGCDARYAQHLDPWGGLMLRRAGYWPHRRPGAELKPPVPSLEEQRKARGQVVAAFKALLPEIDQDELDKEEKEFHRVRCLHAIRFFGGVLTEEQKEELGSEDASAQLDPLKPEP